VTRLVLLVTGSRSLDPSYLHSPGTEASRRWALRIIDHAVLALPLRSVLLTGGCPNGPDAWAAKSVYDNARNTADVVEYRLDAVRYVNGERTREWFPGGPLAYLGAEPWPLARNRHMVDALACLSDEWTVRVLALTAPWSKTGGTAHTAKLARGAGLDVETIDCPREHGPR
jgi:hypothetical protein